MLFRKLIIFAFIVTGCSFKVSFTVQDENEAAKIVYDLLLDIANKENLDSIYSNSHAEFQKVSREDFQIVVDTLGKMLRTYKTRITGYETWDGEDSIAIYGVIEAENVTYFKIGLWGDSTEGYKLYGIHADPKKYEHNGNFGVFEPVINVKI